MVLQYNMTILQTLPGWGCVPLNLRARRQASGQKSSASGDSCPVPVRKHKTYSARRQTRGHG